MLVSPFLPIPLLPFWSGLRCLLSRSCQQPGTWAVAFPSRRVCSSSCRGALANLQRQRVDQRLPVVGKLQAILLCNRSRKQPTHCLEAKPFFQASSYTQLSHGTPARQITLQCPQRKVWQACLLDCSHGSSQLESHTFIFLSKPCPTFKSPSPHFLCCFIF